MKNASKNISQDIYGDGQSVHHKYLISAYLQVVKRMWAYIKENKLQDPKNKQMIKCDEKLSKIVPTKKFRGFGMTKYLKEHMNVGEGGKPKKKAKKVDSDEDSEDEADSAGSGSGSEQKFYPENKSTPALHFESDSTGLKYSQKTPLNSLAKGALFH